MSPRHAPPNWQQLVAVLAAQVPAGRITTWDHVSQRFYGDPRKRCPIKAMLRAAARRGHRELINRVVLPNGALAHFPEADAEQQQEQLAREGIRFTADGRVDLQSHPPVELA